MSNHTWSRTTRTRRRTYLVAAAVAVLGLAGAGIWAGTALVTEANRPSTFERIAVPGAGTVTLGDGDVRVVYAEGPAGAPTVEQISVTGPDDAVVPLRPYRGELQYDVPEGTADAGGDLGTAVATFAAPSSGMYEVGSTSLAGTLAVGPNLAPGAVRAVLLPTAVGLLGLVAGLVLAVRTATRPAIGA